MMPPRGPLITLKVPCIEQDGLSDELSIDMSPGDVLFVLGANGTGKSGLIQHLYKEHRDKAIRITAHRQTWMGSSRVEISPSTKKEQENQLRKEDTFSRARWQDFYAGARYQMSLLNLIQARHARNTAAIRAYRDGKMEDLEELGSEKGDPVSILNRMLSHSNMPITIDIKDDEEITAIKRNQSYSYGVAEMSDAERSILLLAADVLTCPANSLVLIDEPERHIHRSISSSIIRDLLSCRPDCFFAIATHELMLPIDIDSSKILMLRDCVFQEKDIMKWDADFINSASKIDESLKHDIFGSRRKLLFVEGTNNSLDNALYSILFPGVSIIPKESRRNVESSVKAVGEADGFLWIRAYGIVDGDGYSDEKKDELRDHKIYPIDVYQIESIFYDAKIQSNMFPEKLSEIEDAKKNALDSFSRNAETLAKARAFQKCRDEVFSHLPNHEKFENKDIAFRFKDVLDEEMVILRDLIQHEEYDNIVRKYPIRRAGVLDEIARKLDYRDRKAYEKEFLRRIQNNRSLLEQAKSLLGGLPERIAQDSVRTVSDQGE